MSDEIGWKIPLGVIDDAETLRRDAGCAENCEALSANFGVNARGCAAAGVIDAADI